MHIYISKNSDISSFERLRISFGLAISLIAASIKPCIKNSSLKHPAAELPRGGLGALRERLGAFQLTL